MDFPSKYGTSNKVKKATSINIYMYVCCYVFETMTTPLADEWQTRKLNKLPFRSHKIDLHFVQYIYICCLWQFKYQRT